MLALPPFLLGQLFVLLSQDYAASTKSRTTNIGGPNKLYGVLTDKDLRAISAFSLVNSRIT